MKTDALYSKQGICFLVQVLSISTRPLQAIPMPNQPLTKSNPNELKNYQQTLYTSKFNDFGYNNELIDYYIKYYNSNYYFSL